MPIVSIIMPAYNAAEYITAAIESILAQTFKKWELVITDDCSTDNTAEIIEHFCKEHKNIRLIKRNTNSGAARLPRKESAYASTGEFIMTYDADDFLDCDYIEKMYKRQIETGADIILSTLHLCNKDGKPNGFCIPKADFPLKCILTGKEATKYLLGEVAISVSGLLIKREIYLENISSGKNEENSYSYVDEIDQRRLLFNCSKVAFANTKYYYRQHPESLMHKKDIKHYNFLQTSECIYEFVKEHYTEKELFIKLQKDFIQSLIFCQRDYFYYKHYRTDFAKEASKILKDSFYYTKQEKMCPQGFKQKVCMFSYCTFNAISCLYALFLKIITK